MSRTLPLLAAVLLPISASATVTFNIDAGVLRDQLGADMLQNRLVIFAVDTDRNGFVPPSATEFFPNASDQEIARFGLNADGTFQSGSLSRSLSSITGWDAGDPVRLYWFPSLTTGNSSPGAATFYGTYSSATGEDASHPDGWITPSDGSGVTIGYITTDIGGPIGNTGLADQITPVPEPGFYGGIFALGCAAWAFGSRRSSRKG